MQPAETAGISPVIAELVRGGWATPQQAHATGLKILNSGSSLERSAAMAIWLSGMTRETAPAMHRAFTDSTAATGRAEEPGWFLLLNQAGAVLGREALDVFPNEKDKVFAGWMRASPAEAEKHYEAASPGDKLSLQWAWLEGMAAEDPGRALEKAVQVPQSAFNPHHLLGRVIQARGIQEAQILLQRACDAGNVNPESDNFRGLFDALTKSLLHQTDTAGRPEEAAAWLEQQKDAPYVSANYANDAAYNYAMKGDPAEAGAWVERMGGRGLPGLGRAVGKNPEIRARLPEAIREKLTAAGW